MSVPDVDYAVPANAWNNLVVAIEHAGGSMRCELRDGRCISLPARWRGQIAISERLHIDPGVNSVDRSTSLYAERHRRADLAQIPVLAASPPHQDRRGAAFVILDAADDAQNEVKHVLVESAQIRDYFFAPDRSIPWEQQASWFEILGATESSSPAELRLAHRVQCLACTADGRDSAVPVTQLARGFEILMNPELRSHYLALIHDPSFPVAFPPWTVGCLVATGEKQDATFLVHRLIRFIPAMEK